MWSAFIKLLFFLVCQGATISAQGEHKTPTTHSSEPKDGEISAGKWIHDDFFKLIGEDGEIVSALEDDNRCNTRMSLDKSPGDVWQEGCLIKTCKAGAVEKSLADECLQMIEDTVEDILEDKLTEKEEAVKSDILTVSSDEGTASAWQWYRMGPYKLTDREHNGHPVWVSLEAVRQRQELFYNKAGYWMIGVNIHDQKDQEYGGIISAQSGLDLPPVHGWRFSDTNAQHDSLSWEDDPHLTVAVGRTVVYPHGLLVSGEGPVAEKIPTRIGQYFQVSGETSAGRPMWKHLENNNYIFYSGWHWYVGRWTNSIRYPRTGQVSIPVQGWEYSLGFEGDNPWIPDEQLTVTPIKE